MVGVAVRKKRPCSECRRWFLPDARVGDRQRTCGAADCQRARHERAYSAWRKANRDYDRGRRWQDTLEAAKAEPASAPPGAHPPEPVAGVPWDVVQNEMRVEGRVILAGVVRVIGVFVQNEMRRQAIDIAAGVVRHARVAAQTEMEGFR
jgi:hypothetical protein